MSKELLLSGYSDEDAARAESTLDRLIPHLNGRWWLVGGLAIRCYLAESGRAVPQRGVNDIDIVAAQPGVVQPSVTDGLLVHHNHPLKPDGHFRMVLADPKTRIKVDIFPQNPLNPADERIHRVDYKGAELPLQTAEDQLAKTVLDLVMMWGRPVDPKQLDDAERLLEVVDTERADVIYRALQNEHDTIATALASVYERRESRPETFAPKPWQSSEVYDCVQCINDPHFPIAPMGQILGTLGYVELN